MANGQAFAMPFPFSSRSWRTIGALVYSISRGDHTTSWPEAVSNLGPKLAAVREGKWLAILIYRRTPVGVSSGNDSLLAILMALGSGVATCYHPSLHFFATYGCVFARWLRTKTAFCRLDPETYNILPSAIQKASRKIWSQ